MNLSVQSLAKSASTLNTLQNLTKILLLSCSRFPFGITSSSQKSPRVLQPCCSPVIGRKLSTSPIGDSQWHPIIKCTTPKTFSRCCTTITRAWKSAAYLFFCKGTSLILDRISDCLPQASALPRKQVARHNVYKPSHDCVLDMTYPSSTAPELNSVSRRRSTKHLVFLTLIQHLHPYQPRCVSAWLSSGHLLVSQQQLYHSKLWSDGKLRHTVIAILIAAARPDLAATVWKTLRASLPVA
jgi:hypothetical protein